MEGYKIFKFADLLLLHIKALSIYKHIHPNHCCFAWSSLSSLLPPRTPQLHNNSASTTNDNHPCGVTAETARELTEQVMRAAGPGVGGHITVRTEAWNSQDGQVKKSENTQSWGGIYIFASYKGYTFKYYTTSLLKFAFHKAPFTYLYTDWEIYICIIMLLKVFKKNKLRWLDRWILSFRLCLGLQNGMEWG